MNRITQEFLSRKEAAAFLGVNIKTFRQKLEIYLPRYDFGPRSLRFKKEDLERVAEENFRGEPLLRH